MKKIVCILATLLILFSLFGCGEYDSPPLPTPGNNNDEGEDIMHQWNSPPVVKNVFFDDFSEGIRPDVWDVAVGTWDKVSNGLRPENVFYSTYAPRVEAEGATGGIVVIQSNGDFMYDQTKRRQGGLLITKKAYGAGLYEARIKVVPRSGQCTALWTYWSNNGKTLETNECSEIDIEFPSSADFRGWEGTVYSKYVDSQHKVSKSEKYFAEKGYNDGNWYVMAFEWRTNAETGDVAVVYYVDGKQVGVITGDCVPTRSATYWITSRFPDSIGWIGDPQYEIAYMYVDWVRITEYDDPIQVGAVDDTSTTGATGTDLGTGVIPRTNYIANSQFVQPFTIKNMKNVDITSWVCNESAQKSGNSVLISPGGKVYQNITSQYDGYTFEVEVNANVLSGNNFKVYAEFLAGSVNKANPVFTVIGRTEIMEFDTLGSAKKTARFTVGGGKHTQAVRIVLETDDSTSAQVSQVRMFLV
jgi:hypothetical protein